MSQENVEIVLQMYDAYLAGDVEQALAYFHPNVAADFSVRVRDVGDTVCVIATQRGRGKGSGAEVENRWGQLYTLEGDQITSVTMYDSPAKALEAAGLSG